MSVLLNRGDGTLDARRDYSAGNGSSSLAVADFDGDGKLDLATSNGDDGTVSVLLDRPGLCDVQDVAGKKLASARSTLTRFNCAVKVVRRRSKSIARGRVISQKPGFGGVLPGRGKVKLVVSLGRKR